MSVSENPQAFPFAAEYGHPAACGGMTLRDWFAGQAPVTLADAIQVCGWTDEQPANLNDDAERVTVWSVLTLLRYEYADAMLAERNRASEGEAE